MMRDFSLAPSTTSDQLIRNILHYLRQGDFQSAGKNLDLLERNYYYASAIPTPHGFTNLAHVIRQLLTSHILHAPTEQRPLTNLVAIEEAQDYDPISQSVTNPIQPLEIN